MGKAKKEVKEKVKEEQRELTKREEKRLSNFKKVSKELTKEGYKEVDLTVSTKKANKLAILYSLPFIVFFLVLYLLIYRSGVTLGSDYAIRYLIFIIVFVLAIFVHELIHGITFSIFSKNHWKDIDFGMVWADFTPYCTCTSTVKKNQYLLAILMPFLTLGVLPAIIGTILGEFIVVVFGIFMMLGAGGDLLIAYMILRYQNKKDVLYLDHPTDVGVVIFEK